VVTGESGGGSVGFYSCLRRRSSQALPIASCFSGPAERLCARTDNKPLYCGIINFYFHVNEALPRTAKLVNEFDLHLLVTKLCTFRC
jgi:hypothetical protein